MMHVSCRYRNGSEGRREREREVSPRYSFSGTVKTCSLHIQYQCSQSTYVPRAPLPTKVPTDWLTDYSPVNRSRPTIACLHVCRLESFDSLINLNLVLCWPTPTPTILNLPLLHTYIHTYTPHTFHKLTNSRTFNLRIKLHNLFIFVPI